MLDTATKTKDSKGTTTAEDTLQRKSRDAGVVSGGHLVAKALKNEGVDTIFTLCGGHIIDIYDGCVDEGIRIIGRGLWYISIVHTDEDIEHALMITDKVMSKI